MKIGIAREERPRGHMASAACNSLSVQGLKYYGMRHGLFGWSWFESIMFCGRGLMRIFRWQLRKLGIVSVGHLAIARIEDWVIADS